MSRLTIRNLDDWILRSLRERGAGRGVSMEQEARDVLAASLGLPTSSGFDHEGNRPSAEQQANNQARRP